MVSCPKTIVANTVATVLATIVLGQETISDDNFGGYAPILLAMLIAGVGILFSIIGTFFVRISDKAGLHTAVVQKALNMGNWGSIILTAIASYFLVTWILPDGDMYLSRDIRPAGEELQSIGHFTKYGVMGAIILGLVVGTL